VTEKSLL